MNPNKIIEDLHMTDDELFYRILTSGIQDIYKICETYEFNKSLEAFTLIHLPRVRFLIMHALYTHEIQSCKTLKHVKDMMNTMLKAIYKCRPYQSEHSYDDLFIEFIHQRQTQIHTIQMKEHLFESSSCVESVVTACAPIVPYMGTIRTPFESITSVLTPTTAPSSQITEAVSPVMTQSPGLIYEIQNHCLSQMQKIVMTNDGAQTIIQHRMELGNIGDAIDISRVLGMCSIYQKDPLYWNYYVYAFLYKNAKSITPEILKNFQIALSPETQSFESMLNATMDLSSSEILDDLPELKTPETFMKDASSYTGVNHSSDPLKLFDITALMNYIYTARRYRANSYTNSAFASQPYIDNFIFYREFLIIQPSNKENTDIDYVYIPVIDDLNDSKVVIIKFWRNKKVNILSEGEFRDEINQQ